MAAITQVNNYYSPVEGGLSFSLHRTILFGIASAHAISKTIMTVDPSRIVNSDQPVRLIKDNYNNQVPTMAT